MRNPAAGGSKCGTQSCFFTIYAVNHWIFQRKTSSSTISHRQAEKSTLEGQMRSAKEEAGTFTQSNMPKSDGKTMVHWN